MRSKSGDILWLTCTQHLSICGQKIVSLGCYGNGETDLITKI